MRGLGHVKLSPAPSPPVQEQCESGHAGLTQTSLLTSSRGSGRCLWETQHVRVRGVGAAIPTSHLSQSSLLASLTSHFDGHGLLGADQVNDFLVGTGGDGVAIDPDDLVPYLGTDMGESVKQSRRPTTSCPQLQKGLTTSKSFYLCCSTRSQLSTALTAEGSKAGNIFSSRMEKPRSGLGKAGSGQVVKLRQESGHCPLPHLGASVTEVPSGSGIQQPTWPLSLPALRSGLLSLSITNTHTVSQNRDLGLFTQL